jgi:hypothetical protein
MEVQGTTLTMATVALRNVLFYCASMKTFEVPKMYFAATMNLFEIQPMQRIFSYHQANGGFFSEKKLRQLHIFGETWASLLLS